MTTRVALLKSIAHTTADYREGEMPKPTAEHVDRWISQFEGDVQLPLLQELDHVLKETYLSKEWVIDFLTRQVKNEKLAGEDPCDFWKNANFLKIQQNGDSQEEMLQVFDEGLKAECNFSIEDCGSEGGPYIYLDDGLFNGFRAGDDLDIWLEDLAPENGEVILLFIVSHSYGEWKTRQRLVRRAKDLGKKIEFHFWRAISFENNPNTSKISEVFWPATLPENELLKAYLAEKHKFPFKPREEGGSCEHQIFSCEEGRQLLETQLLLAGLKIRSFCENPTPSLRPLGFSPFGLGFGATVVTFRNCPNNSPLALWWGDPEAAESHPFSKWYPLFPRKTYGEEIYFGEISFK